MSRYDEEAQEEQVIDTDEFVGGCLSTGDVDGPIVVTITKAWVEIPHGSDKRKIHLRFRELSRTLILNMENTVTLREIFGTKYANQWVGRRFEMYVDPTVKMGGKVVGGIRVRPLRQAEQRNRPVSRPQARSDEAYRNGHSESNDEQEVW